MVNNVPTPRMPRCNSNGYYITYAYHSDRRRTSVSFGRLRPGHDEMAIITAFQEWLKLYQADPDHTLSFHSPYRAISQGQSQDLTVLSVGQLYETYYGCVKKQKTPGRTGQYDGDITKLEQLKKFMDPCWNLRVGRFNLDHLLAVRQAMVAFRYFKDKARAKPLAYKRLSVNAMIKHVQRMFLWGLRRGYAGQLQCNILSELRPLRRGHAELLEHSNRRPVTRDEVDKVKLAMTPTLADAMEMLWQTGARPGEITRMRPRDIDRADKRCWIYVPGSEEGPVGGHKTAGYDLARLIPINKACREILLRRVTDWASKGTIFSPEQSVKEKQARDYANRRTPLSCGNSPGMNRKPNPMVKPGKQYKPSAFSTAFRKACSRAGVDPFTPYDLRHTASTRIRARASKDEAQMLLGHTNPKTTEGYLLEEKQEVIKRAKLWDAIGD